MALSLGGQSRAPGAVDAKRGYGKAAGPPQDWGHHGHLQVGKRCRRIGRPRARDQRE